MAARRGQKIKLFYIVDILKKYSDENHPLTATEICEKLLSNGVTAERKAIYDDMNQLIDYGFDVIKTHTPKAGFFLGAREFEVPEIYLLCDAVRAARFITPKKSRELIAKLDSMLSTYQINARGKNVYFDNVGKTKNEEIFYNIDVINRAIENNHKISFKYLTKTLGDNREIITNIKERVISPYALTWQDDHYYLIGNYDKYDNLIHLRVDRMKAVNEANEAVRHFSEVSEYKDIFDIADYTNKLFGMFGGKTEKIDLRCSRKILEPVLDRFTEDIFIRNITDTHFDISVNVVVSDAIATWIMNYGENIEVVSPQYLREMITNKAKSVLSVYGE